MHKMIFADLHIHSKYSIACSRDADLLSYSATAEEKGIGLAGTGDILHGKYMDECRSLLQDEAYGLYRRGSVLFMLTAEVSLSYRDRGRTRRIHLLCILPDFLSASKLKRGISGFSKIESDGRPIVKMSMEDFFSELKEASEDSLLIPAHIWTPHFGLLGAKSGYDSVSEIENADKMFTALETGLSSDPYMNSMVSEVRRFTLVSFSDAHSPSKMGREAVVLKRQFTDIKEFASGLKDGSIIDSTLEFYPQEGKYYMAGHRDCSYSTRESVETCPVCGKKLTDGVYNRIARLKDMEPERGGKVFYSLPIDTIASKLISLKKGIRKKDSLSYINERIPEMMLRTYASKSEIESKFTGEFASFIEEMRSGALEVEGGYDGVFGRFSLSREV